MQWLEQHLAKYPGTVVAVTHDRYFLDNVAGWILELYCGRAIGYEGNYSTYLESKASRLKVEGQKDAKRAKRLKEELEWVRSNAKGRQAKSKARLARYEEMAAEADKMRKLDFEEIQIPPGPRLGSIVVEVNNLSKAFGKKVLIDDLSFTLPRNGIVGVIGPNGAGKTTLFKMIQDSRRRTPARSRSARPSRSRTSTRAARTSTRRSRCGPSSDQLDYINVGQVEMPSRAYVSAFGFKGPDQQKPAGAPPVVVSATGSTSPSPSSRAATCCSSTSRPTTSTSRTCPARERAAGVPGGRGRLPHDRWFLDRVATHILAYEGDSKWFWFEGNFESYEKNKIERLGGRRAHRATYKKLTRLIDLAAHLPLPAARRTWTCTATSTAAPLPGGSTYRLPDPPGQAVQAGVRGGAPRDRLQASVDCASRWTSSCGSPR